MEFKRCFTKAYANPYDGISWEKRKSELRNSKGEIIFQKDSVVVPSFWSQIATDILA
jgi:ribonucleoside-diphosphate reductase alpha chain